MTTSVKFNGREVKNPVARILVAALVLICVVAIILVFGLVMAPAILGFIVLFFVLTVPLHFILRLCGRRGFYVRKGNSHTWTSSGAFQRN